MPIPSPRRFALILATAVVILVAAGIPVSRVLSGTSPTPTPTALSTATITPVPSPTVTTTGTVVPTPALAPAATTTATATATTTATAAPTLVPTAIPTAVDAGDPSTGYWHTSGNRVVDASGRTVRIAAVNWFGMENVFYVPAGLDKRPLDAILTEVESLGFNAIRLPFSNQLVEMNPIVTRHLEANPDLQGLHALQLMDRIVADAGRHDLRIILDNGRSEAGTQPEENGLWYGRKYPEKAWLGDWLTLVRRYAGNPTVVAVDLRNEPHTAGPGPWSLKTYLHQGSTWGPYGGIENPATDWRLAAERAGDAIQSVNPHLLIMVEGLQMYPDPGRRSGVDTYWWGGVLQPAGRYPVRLTVPHHLVYSPHEYGPYKTRMWFFSRNMTYASLAAVWNRHWGYLMNAASKSSVPIFLGEFGTCGVASCVSDVTPGSTGQWFTFFLRYLRAHPNVGWAYWALNGTNQRGVDCPNYILKKDWQGVRLPVLLKALQGVGLTPRPGG